ncbi:MAG: hypothetical protein EOM54_08870 [Clostridia bacterium]|nr:hypothetical protein [Clostridia bacterium]
MHHVLAQLLKAELTNRTPVVFWSKNSLYGTEEGENAFEHFFLPVSSYSVHDLKGENVILHDLNTGMEEAVPFIQPGHPLFGASIYELYSTMLKKYIRLQPGIQREIDQFYEQKMLGKNLIGVHIRGSDKIKEVNHLHKLNEGYPAEIDYFLKISPGAHIFIMTDCSDIVSEYIEKYGDRLIYTDCKRVMKRDEGVHFQNYTDKKRKGIEVIKDTWLAAKCDYFIGNGHSNVSRAVSECKIWPDGSIKLLY